MSDMSDAIRTLKVDFDKCSKAGECYYNHPGLFMMTDSGYPAIKVRRPDGAGEIREALEAVDVCPSGAITVERG